MFDGLGALEAIRVQKHVLNDIFDIGRVPQDAPGDSVDAWPVLMNKSLPIRSHVEPRGSNRALQNISRGQERNCHQKKKTSGSTALSMGLRKERRSHSTLYGAYQY